MRRWRLGTRRLRLTAKPCLLSSDEEEDGETADREGQKVSKDITLDTLQCAIESVSGVARDDVQARGDQG